MLQNIFRNMQPVVKNLLIINGLFFLATIVLEKQGIYLETILGLYYVDSNAFEPYQLATHFFMHGGLGHIFFNMFGLVVFGNVLEQVWGAKRFLIFYFVTALGAAFLYQMVQGIEIYQAAGTFFPDLDDNYKVLVNGYEYSPGNPTNNMAAINILSTRVVGASGAIYGLLGAVAFLFPNTTVYLYFAIPIKMKWLALILGGVALLMGIQDNPGDSVAHFAHLGGMLFGLLLVKIWQKDNSRFY
ncbi:MAG: rhomboid family intramembrane serine protease [Crocinitomicaceae bacterium]